MEAIPFPQKLSRIIMESNCQIDLKKISENFF